MLLHSAGHERILQGSPSADVIYIIPSFHDAKTTMSHKVQS